MDNLFYIAFDDGDRTDPTYSSIDEAYLVVAPDSDGNPCGHPAAQWVPVVPAFPDELYAWAEAVGWKVEERDGKLVVVTDIPA